MCTSWRRRLSPGGCGDLPALVDQVVRHRQRRHRPAGEPDVGLFGGGLVPGGEVAEQGDGFPGQRHGGLVPGQRLGCLVCDGHDAPSAAILIAVTICWAMCLSWGSVGRIARPLSWNASIGQRAGAMQSGPSTYGAMTFSTASTWPSASPVTTCPCAAG